MARIHVKLDQSIKAESSSGKPGATSSSINTTRLSLPDITDNRTDKRIYFSFAEGSTPAYWVTIVKMARSKSNLPKKIQSSYELKQYISDDKLLEILIWQYPSMTSCKWAPQELDGS